MLRTTLLCVLLATILVSSATAQQSENIMEISKTKPVPIVLAKEASASEKSAAKELQNYLRKITDAECPIVEVAPAPAIHIGPTELAKEAIADYASLGREEWVIKSYNGNLILAGGRPRGTLYAVYEFLEQQGVIWPAPTLDYVPRLSFLLIPPVDQRNKPAFLIRGIYTSAPMNSAEAYTFLVRNKMNNDMRAPIEMGGMDNFGRPKGCHTFFAYSKPDWPDEWFAMNGKGERVRSTSANSGQLCLTNPDLRKAMVARLKEFIAEDRKTIPQEIWPFIYDISHNDTGGQCQCPDCKAFAEREGSYSGPMIDFVNSIANEIVKEYPEIYVQTFAYTWTLDAPKTIRPAKNVLVRVCKLGCEFLPSGKANTQFPNVHPRNKDYYGNFMKWAAIADNIAIWDYWIVYRRQYQPPYLNARNLQQDMVLYRNNHVKTLFVENESFSDTSFAQFKLWFGLKMLQNPDQSYDTLADKFCKAYYGPAAKLMREYMDYLQQREIDADFPIGRGTIFSFANMPGAEKRDDILPYTDRDFFEKSNALLDAAERRSNGNPVFSQNVRRERIPVDITLINSFARYQEDTPVGSLIPPTLEALVTRYSDNYLDNIKYYFDSPVFSKNPGRITYIKAKMEQNKISLTNPEDSLPEQFKGKNAVEFNWAMFSEREVIHDKDAYGEHAKKLPGSTSLEFHKLPFKMGLYTVETKTFHTTYELPEDKIPQDEKYHWYTLGKFEITPRTYIWFHWTWRLQQYVDSVFVKDGDNFWNIHVSVKLTGEPYVKGSKSEPRVLVDRIILTK